MYTHPIFPRENEGRAGVFNLDKQQFELKEGSTYGLHKFYTNLDEYFQELRDSEKVRITLGIPRLTYHAYSFTQWDYNKDHVKNIIEWARGHNLEVRTWNNEESGMLLIVIADPDLSEDSGWALYEYVQQNAKSYRGYGLSSWYEFCKFGLPVPPDWQLIERNNYLFAASPDGQQFVTFGY
jgi:hypothetical protein